MAGRIRIVAAAVVGVLGVLVGPIAPARAQKVDLRPRWEKGAQWRFRMETSSVNSIKMGDEASRRTSASQEAQLLLKVIDSQPEADSTVELIIESSKATADGPDGKRRFDSSRPGDKDAKDRFGDGLRALVGLKLTLTVAPDGHISRITGGEGLMSSDLVAPFTNPDKASDLFGPILSLKKGDGFASVGQSWENEDRIDTGLLGRIRVSNRHTLRSAAGGTARVVTDGTIEADSESPDSPITIRDGKVTGSYEWDTRAGMLRRMDSRVSFKIEAEGIASITSDATQKLTRID